MQIHRFKVGRTVEFSPSGQHLKPLGRFQIVRTLPIEHGVVQYHIKSLQDGHQRVAMESDLT